MNWKFNAIVILFPVATSIFSLVPHKKIMRTINNIFSPAIEDPGTPEIDLSVTDDGDDGTLLIEDPRMTCIFS